MLAARASSSAISARLKAGSCWRQSATNHWPSTEALRWARPLSTALSTTGSANAAPSNSVAMSTKPLARLSPRSKASNAMPKASAATQP
ncbi:hypothetical protein D3C84_1143570 [compost metagenome]